MLRLWVARAPVGAVILLHAKHFQHCFIQQRQGNVKFWNLFRRGNEIRLKIDGQRIDSGVNHTWWQVRGRFSDKPILPALLLSLHTEEDTTNWNAEATDIYRVKGKTR